MLRRSSRKREERRFFRPYNSGPASAWVDIPTSVTEEEERSGKVTLQTKLVQAFFGPDGTGCVQGLQTSNENKNVVDNNCNQRNHKESSNEEDDVTAEMDSVDRDAMCGDIPWEMRK